jgi:hypothetical protein
MGGTDPDARMSTAMQFVILRVLRHNELGMFHSYRRLGKEGAKQRAINFDSEVVDRVFPAASDRDAIPLEMRYRTDDGVGIRLHRLKRQEKNWRLEGNCPRDHYYDFVDPGCLFAMVVDSGSRPAHGAWAVYAEDDPVAVAILAGAESGRLVRRSMVALHGREGEDTLALLHRSTPELFPSEGTSVTRKSEAGGKVRGTKRRLDPNPRRLARILAGVGHSLPSAVADIVDNSIGADATEIRITLSQPDGGHGRWMTILDNGRGMDEHELDEAMRVGSEVEYEAGDLGKFGYGLKGASWSQTDHFTVVSRRAGKAARHLSWDTEHMDSWEAQDGPLEPWVRTATHIEGHGTCVMWRDMRPPEAMPTARGVEPHTAEIQELRRHLALVFHRFLEGRAAGRKKVTIRVQDIAIEPNDPVGHSLVHAYVRQPVRVPTVKGSEIVQVQAFLLPSEQEVKDLHGDDTDAARGDLDRMGMYGRRNESQGVYVYRNDRLIQWGGWHDMWATSDEKTKLARVTVEFGNALDDQFKVNIAKRMVSLSQQLQEAIKVVATVARNDSKKKYLPRQKTGTKPTRRTQPGTSGAAQGVNSPPAGPGSPPAGPAGGAAKDAGVPVRNVKTSAFAWKLTNGIMGRLEVQVSDSESELRNLFEATAGDPQARAMLTEFLRRLDSVGVQTLLVPKQAKR